ncbi:aspartic peptidase A1 [Obba rivulosa]|uniref:Aspartic peptidase A1 n=1 Tax=Obba rivulosa TaxID=1052685 RepID=A0A8E2AKZ0_9APHY|nr:aspartic peptidase A1 [Obba rivulosa]
MFSKQFSTFIFLSLFSVFVSGAPSASSQPISTLPITRRLNLSGARTLIEHDVARAQTMRTMGSPKQQSAFAAAFDASGSVLDEGTLYIATIGIGSPPTDYSVILDSGSSNTWVGAEQTYVQTSTSQTTGQQVAVDYGSGSFSGNEYLDTVTIAPGLTIQRQSIGVATQSEGLNGLDGIMGIGPTDLTSGTLSNGQLIPTVTDNAFNQGLISAQQVGILFEPINSLSDANGEVSFGQPDVSKFSGELTSVPITTTSPASDYVGIDQSITYGSSRTNILSTTAGIVDTGTTLLLLSSDAFSTYTQLTGATTDQTTGLLTLPASQFGNLESMFFNIGGVEFEFTPDAQIWPRSLNSQIGGSDDNIYIMVGDNGSPSGSGLDFTNGLAWLERFYFVYDSGNNQAGFANTPFTNSTSNSGN